MFGFNLQGKVAVVTGSASGIGKGIAEMFVKAGADLVLHDLRSPEDVETQRSALALYGPTVKYHRADLTRPQEVHDLIASTIRQFGKIDILVNNAGFQYVAPITEFPLEKWDAMLAVHLTAPFVATQAALPSMIKQGWGRIINLASAQGVQPYALKSAYVTAKHGIIGFTKATALESAPFGVTCNVIAPGFVETPLVIKQIEDRARQEGTSIQDATKSFLAAQPTGRFTTIQQIAETALFLCSPACNNTTGAVLNIDGGWTAGRPMEVVKASLPAAPPSP